MRYVWDDVVYIIHGLLDVEENSEEWLIRLVPANRDIPTYTAAIYGTGDSFSIAGHTEEYKSVYRLEFVECIHLLR